MEDNLLKVAKSIRDFKENNCPRCYHGKILNLKYDYEEAEMYLKKHNISCPENVKSKAYWLSAEYHIMKNKDHETFWKVESIPCPHRYCKFSEV